ncbi:MAG: hypothetical protein VYA30_13880, partial [Myxococcota bacterium]|nr:hypothetical protein [Myxococcota bacterium]
LSLSAAFGGSGWVDPISGRRHQLWINLTDGYPHSLRDAFNPNHTAHGLSYHLRWFEEDVGDPNAWSKKERSKAGFRLARPKTPETGWIRLSQAVTLTTDELSGWCETPRGGRAPEEKLARMRSILGAVHRAYRTPCIPVHRLDGHRHDAETLFQIFIRLNSAGTPLGAAEQFFAGVKQQWLEAEERLSPLTEFAGPLKRRDLISLVARTAAKVPLRLLGLPTVCRPNTDNEIRVGDPIPLSLERLAKAPVVTPHENDDPRNLLIWKMDAITDTQSKLRLDDAMQWVNDALFDRLALGVLGLSSIGWSAAVAWVLGFWSRTGQRPQPIDKWVKPLLSFCFWTSVLGSRSEGRRKFERDSFNLGWMSGRSGYPYPFWRGPMSDGDHNACLRAAKLVFGYSRVLDRLPADEDDQDACERLMSKHKWLFLGPYQDIGRDWTPSVRLDPRIEWDHIFPRVRADRFLKQSYVTKRTGKKQWKRSQYHRWTNRIGNFAGIDATANRSFGDRALKDKLAYNKKSANGRARSYLDMSFVRTDPKLDARSCALLFQLHEHEDRLERELGGSVFENFARRRGAQIWTLATDRVGGMLTHHKVLDWMENGWGT